ncbi:hypothetical protein ACNKHK_03690 [Shigella flexneri]
MRAWFAHRLRETHRRCWPMTPIGSNAASLRISTEVGIEIDFHR